MAFKNVLQQIGRSGKSIGMNCQVMDVVKRSILKWLIYKVNATFAGGGSYMKWNECQITYEIERGED